MSCLADQLLRLRADAVLVLAAERGLILELSCAMPECRCPEGRSHFEKKGMRGHWAPSADRFPVPGRDGGTYVPENIRLAHGSCNWAEGGKSNLGRKRTKEQRRNISVAHLGNKSSLGRVVSAETRSKISAGNRGKNLGNQHAVGKQSAETRNKKSVAHKGVPWSEARRAAFERGRSVSN
jgi:hypothetical protein